LGGKKKEKGHYSKKSASQRKRISRASGKEGGGEGKRYMEKGKVIAERGHAYYGGSYTNIRVNKTKTPYEFEYPGLDFNGLEERENWKPSEGLEETV